MSQIFKCCKCGIEFEKACLLDEHLAAHKKDIVKIDLCSDEEEKEENEVVNNQELLILGNESDVEETIEDYSFSLEDEEDGEVLDPINFVELQEEYREVESDNDDGIIPFTPSRARNKKLIKEPKRTVKCNLDTSVCLYIAASEEIQIPHYKCLACERIFIRELIFNKHIIAGKCYISACDVCAATFETNSDFYEHYTVEHNYRVICKFCFHTLNNMRNLKEHMKRHFDLFKFSCQECDKGFYTKREYNSHYNNRHKEFMESCKICDEKFTNKLMFSNHAETHLKNNLPILR